MKVEPARLAGILDVWEPERKKSRKTPRCWTGQLEAWNWHLLKWGKGTGLGRTISLFLNELILMYFLDRDVPNWSTDQGFVAPCWPVNWMWANRLPSADSMVQRGTQLWAINRQHSWMLKESLPQSWCGDLMWGWHLTVSTTDCLLYLSSPFHLGTASPGFWLVCFLGKLSEGSHLSPSPLLQPSAEATTNTHHRPPVLPILEPLILGWHLHYPKWLTWCCDLDPHPSEVWVPMLLSGQSCCPFPSTSTTRRWCIRRRPSGLQVY